MKIDKNIPERASYSDHRLRKLRGQHWLSARRMDVGDSVLVNTVAERASLSNAIKAQGYEATTRKEDDKFRVWRLS